MPIKSLASIALLSAFLVSCNSTNMEETSTPDKTVAEKAFASGGSVDMQLESGNYTIRAAAGDQIRVIFGGNTGNASANLTTDGQRATLGVKDTPHNNFHAAIEVPATSNLTIHLSAGNLEVASITGDKDVNSGAGNVEIAVANPDDYSTAEGSVKAGDISADVFGKSGSGLNPHFEWQGHGTHVLRATLGAGNLVIKGK